MSSSSKVQQCSAAASMVGAVISDDKEKIQSLEIRCHYMIRFYSQC